MVFKKCFLLSLGHTDSAETLKWEQSEDMFAFILAQTQIVDSKCISYLSAEHNTAAILFLRGKKKKTMFVQ